MFWVNSSSNHNMFFHFLQNVIDEEILNELEDHVKTQDLLQPAKFISETDAKDSNVRVTEIAWIDTRTNPNLYSALTTAINKANNEYFDFSITYLETLQYSVYPAGGHYKCHTDAALKGQNGDSRKLSFSVGLNDPDEYEGGELEIWTGGDNKITQLKKFEMVLFPSWIPHQVHSVKTGTRKSLVGWIHGPDFR
jgi:PKHD-type hydroxylase